MITVECYWIDNGHKCKREASGFVCKDKTELEKCRKELAEIHGVNKRQIIFHYTEKNVEKSLQNGK